MISKAAREAEQRRVEELWESSRRAYGEARRRENCVAWIGYHDRLASGYRDQSERHRRERDRYQAVLMCAHTTNKGTA